MSLALPVNITETTTIIAADSAKAVDVFGFFLTSTGVVTVRFDDTNDVVLTGPMQIPANGYIQFPQTPGAFIQVATGVGIKLVLVTGSGTIGGFVLRNTY